MLEQLSVISFKGVESIKDTFNEVLVNNLKELSPLRSSIELIENTSLEQLKAQNEIMSFSESDVTALSETQEGDSSQENKWLSEDEKQQIKSETDWSDEIINAIDSMEEYTVYKDAGLQEVDINDRKSLIRNDIDWNREDSMGRSNRERAEAGLSPINKEGNTIELHHIGQKSDGALAELTPDEHRGKENYSVLHDTHKESEIDRVAFNGERNTHWKERAGEGVQNA